MSTRLYLRLVTIAIAVALAPRAAAQTVSPKPLNPHMPAYPAELTDTGQDGSATIEVLVKTDGSMTNATISAADQPAFGTAALAAIQDWKFKPGSKDGAPAEMKVAIPFQFYAPFEQKINAQAKRKVFITLPEPALSAKDYGQDLKVITDAHPFYPRTLVRSGVIANVMVNFIVAPDGTVVNPRFYSPPRVELLVPTLAAVSRMTYEPPVKDGKPVFVEASITLHFEERAPARAGP